MARQPSTTLALARIETEEKTTDLKLRLKGKLAVDLADYRRAYVETNGQSVELDQLVPHMLATDVYKRQFWFSSIAQRIAVTTMLMTTRLASVAVTSPWMRPKPEST